MKAPDTPISEAQLHAFVDGRLDDMQRQAVERAVEEDPALRDTVDAWRSQRVALRGLHRDLLDESLPPFLANAARQADEFQRQTTRRWQYMAMAASVFVAFTAGWIGHGAWRGGDAAPAVQFARQAVVAHVVYAPEVRHPVEVTAAQQDHLVQWLSKRLGQPLKVPVLQPQGFDLVGGRLLPGADGARAQFMFQNTQGERLTLYIGAIKHPARGDGAESPGETAFRLTQDGNVSSFYWMDQGVGYALSGPLPRNAMLDMAHSVYRQLNAR